MKQRLRQSCFREWQESSYSVDYIVEIHCKKESNLDNALGLLYEQEKNGIPTKTTNLFKIHYSKDFRFSDFRASLGKSSENSGRKQDGARSSRKVKFSLKDSDGNELSPEQQEYYNPKIKELLSSGEWKSWYDKRAEYIRGGNFVKIDNNILIPVSGRKVVITDTTFENPYAKDVLVLTDYFDGDANDLITYIEKEVIKYGYSIQEIWKLVKNVYGETIFDIHNGAVGVNSKVNQRRKSDNRQNGKTLQGNQDGERTSTRSPKIDSEIKSSKKEDISSKRAIRYNFENRIVTYKDGTTAKFTVFRDGGENGLKIKGVKRKILLMVI